MSRSTISTFQLFELFPDEETARVYLEGRLWPNGPVCPDCKSGARVAALGVCATRKAGFYRCAACEFDFTIRTNTIFERSKVPLHKWSLLGERLSDEYRVILEGEQYIGNTLLAAVEAAMAKEPKR